MPLFSSPYWNVNIRPESHLVSIINLDAASLCITQFGLGETDRYHLVCK